MNYHHLTYEQRCQIYALKKRKISLRKIAHDLNVAVSRISREIKRNSGKKGYRYKQAQKFAEARQIGRKGKITANLKFQIEEGLAKHWSPQQISGRLKLQSALSVSHETIYRHVWQDKRNGGCLYKKLRHHGKKYNKRKKVRAGRGFIPGRIDIDQRPDIVQSKSRFGDWELDTIVGRNHKGAIVSMVERFSKFTLLVKLSNRKKKDVTEAIIAGLSPLQPLTHTLTSDNGKEFAGHSRVANALDAKFFFAKPYRSWERGLNEHTNGLVRQYLPKKTDFSTVSQSLVIEIQNSLNTRPRAVLNYQTPMEVVQSMTVALPT